MEAVGGMGGAGTEAVPHPRNASGGDSRIKPVQGPAPWGVGKAVRIRLGDRRRRTFPPGRALSVPLLHDDLKKDPHVGLGGLGVMILRGHFGDRGLCLAISDGGNPPVGNDP